MSNHLLSCAAFTALMVIGGSIFFLQHDQESAAPIATPKPSPVMVEPAPIRREETPPPMPVAASAPMPMPIPPRPPMSQPTALMLENQFRAARRTEERIDLAGELAGLNNAEAVQSIGRLFRTERHPKVKMALIAGLADISQETDEAGKRTMLGEALNRQPRDIRVAALDVLSQLDDAQSLALLRRAITFDPDKEVRETATALYQARVGAPAKR